MSEMTLEKVRDWHRRRSDDVRRGLAKGSLIDSDRMANAIDAHIAQHAEMARDAARYRWLRDGFSMTESDAEEPVGLEVTKWMGDGTGEGRSGIRLDEDVDRAMTGESP